MIVRVDDALAIEGHCDVFDREEGYEEHIPFALVQSGPKETRLFPADELSFLLTAEQAEQLASALSRVAIESGHTPRR